MKRSGGLAGFAVGASVLVGFMSSSGCSGGAHDSGFGDDGGSGDNGGGGGDGGVFGDGGVHIGDGSLGGTCSTHCSSDLHSIVDCNNNVLMTCPANEGCGGTGCVAACDAAQANKSTIGCDYYAVDPDIIPEVVGGCFAAYIANTWDAPITITADWNGMSLTGSFMYTPSGSGPSLTYAPLANNTLPVGQIAIVFLDNVASEVAGLDGLNFNCPAGVQPALTTQDGATHGTGTGHAFHITTSAPAVAYDMFPFGGGQSAATSATLLLPTTAWDKNYVAVDAFPESSLSGGQPFIEIVAMTDATTVQINPTAAIVAGGGLAATPANTTGTYTLNKGEYLQFTQDAELTGSAILANNPVGVWGGESCLNIDVGVCCCDSAHQEIPPVSALGNEYVAVKYRDRIAGMAESPPWHIVGAVDGTVLTYDPATPPGAPTTLRNGQIVQFLTGTPFVVKSQDAMHPFYMSAHMTGADTIDPDETYGRGDPEFVNVIPPAEYLAAYTFFTDPTYSETNLVIVRQSVNGTFADVSLDCAGVLAGWQPIDSADTLEYTRADLVTGNFYAVGNCSNGRHEITSTLPFGLTVWGWGSEQTTAFSTQYVSYAYPAGASVQPINTVVVTPAPR
jgi:IgGFc binding protein